MNSSVAFQPAVSFVLKMTPLPAMYKRYNRYLECVGNVYIYIFNSVYRYKLVIVIYIYTQINTWHI